MNRVDAILRLSPQLHVMPDVPKKSPGEEITEAFVEVNKALLTLILSRLPEQKQPRLRFPEHRSPRLPLHRQE